MLTLIFPENPRQCASFLTNMGILFLLFKWVTTVPNKLIDILQIVQKENTDCFQFTTTFHPQNHSVKSIIQKNSKFLQFFKTTQRLVLSFCNLYLSHSNTTKTLGTLWSEVHFKPVTNVEISNMLSHNAKLVLSFTT